MKIYRFILYILLFFLIIDFTEIQSFASTNGKIEYNYILFDYTKLNFQKIKNDADQSFELYLNTKNETDKKYYLNLATSKYYILTKVDYSKIEPYIQLGRIYDYTNHQRLAKENFSKAINIDANNPHANFYFGEFYFKRRDYKRALKYYKIAYDNGFNNTYEINYRLAVIHEKFGDIVNSEKYYKISNKIKPDNKIQKKILLLNELNYDKTEYYHIIRE